MADKNKVNQGFTLIELLVVIIIITILASVVLITFPTVQDRAKDSRIISAIGQARAVMYLAYSVNNNSYGAFSTTSPDDMKPLYTEVLNNGGMLKIGTSSNGQLACSYSKLNSKVSGASSYYCTDSKGYSINTTTDPGTANQYCATSSNTKCPGTP